MRLFGHPVHVMLIHFPIALWPAHEALHVFASRLPTGTAAVAFWLLVAGTCLGWLAALFGLIDLVSLWQERPAVAARTGLIHAILNGGVVVGFTIITTLEYRVFPNIEHSAGFLSA